MIGHVWKSSRVVRLRARKRRHILLGVLTAQGLRDQMLIVVVYTLAHAQIAQLLLCAGKHKFGK